MAKETANYKPAADVKRGIKLLDVKRPGWRNRVDRETLDMGDNDHCLLGQVFGHYHNGLYALQLPMTTDLDAYFGFEVPHQFGTNGRPEEEKNRPFYDALTTAWKETL